jgi:hypothetical protein
MSWLERLKNLNAPGEPPYKTYETGKEAEKDGFVGFVGCRDGDIQKTQTDPDCLDAPATVVESVAVVVKQDPQSIAPNENAAQATPDPDRCCWPNSSAMNTAEIATMEARIHMFGSRGLNQKQAEAMAERLMRRDRRLDELRLCYECQHLQVQSATHWRHWPELRCGNWKASGLSLEARHAGMSEDFAHKLQRCNGFKAAP